MEEIQREFSNTIDYNTGFDLYPKTITTRCYKCQMLITYNFRKFAKQGWNNSDMTKVSAYKTLCDNCWEYCVENATCSVNKCTTKVVAVSGSEYYTPINGICKKHFVEFMSATFKNVKDAEIYWNTHNQCKVFNEFISAAYKQWTFYQCYKCLYFKTNDEGPKYKVGTDSKVVNGVLKEVAIPICETCQNN